MELIKSKKSYLQAILIYFLLLGFFYFISLVLIFINFRYFQNQSELLNIIRLVIFNFFTTNAIALFFSMRFLDKEKIVSKIIYCILLLLISLSIFYIKVNVVINWSIQDVMRSNGYSESSKKKIIEMFKKEKDREIGSFTSFSGEFLLSSVFVLTIISLVKTQKSSLIWVLVVNFGLNNAFVFIL